MKIALLLTGNELMTGDTIDSNSSMIAQKLNPEGFDIACKVTVGDDLALLVDTMQQLTEQYPVVLVNGGLGPTEDDLTAQALAQLSQSPLVRHPEAYQHLQAWCGQRGLEISNANLTQAMLPQAAEIIANPIGSAVGIGLLHSHTQLLCTPGVPSELRLMLDNEIIPALKRDFPNAQSRLVRRLRVFGIGESSLQQRVLDEIPDWPAEVTLGFRVCMPLIELKLEVEDEAHKPQQQWCEQKLAEILPGYVIGENDQSMEEVLVNLLRHKNAKVVTAESCTGGLIASKLTSIAGASDVYEAGFVSYSNRIKSELLGVDTQLLEVHGAVSEPVVLAMAKGALKNSAADFAIAISGVAGPGGGTKDKPVGTVWIAWGNEEGLSARQFCFPVSRQIFQQIASCVSMDLLRRELLGLDSAPTYFSAKK